jgi:poly-gamma-glutamate synthesis protein (capsule biosynthesis protein)
MNAPEAAEPWRTEIGGQRFSVISCGAYPVENSGFNGKKTAAAAESKAGILWESERVNEIVRAEKTSGAFVIVNVHGGQEYVRTPSAGQRRFYESLCDSGADAVFGSHPHVLQPTETHGSSIIVYSLGNFVFPGMQGMSGAEESMIVRLGVYRNRIVSREEFPAKLSGISVGLRPGVSTK